MLIFKNVASIFIATLLALIWMRTAVRGQEFPASEPVQVIPSRFKERNQEGDFAWMIKQSAYSDALFVFNDNENQFKSFTKGGHDRRDPGCSVGGGNAVIRPYQCLTPPRSAGVPTGPNYLRLTDANRRNIDLAFEHIRLVIKTFRYKRLFYAAQDDKGTLGTGIFHVGADVKAYIVGKFQDLNK